MSIADDTPRAVMNMPYIMKQYRYQHEPHISDPYKTPGQLNFSITKLCQYYLKDQSESYQTYNDIIGVLECCKQELYRRLISKYEDTKIESNGDVF